MTFFLGLLFLMFDTEVYESSAVIYHEARLPKTSVSPDGSHILVGGRSGNLRAFTQSGEFVSELPAAATAAAFGPTGKRVAIGYDDGSVAVCAFPNWTPLVTWRPHRGEVADVVWLPGDCIGTLSGSPLNKPFDKATTSAGDLPGSFCVASTDGQPQTSLSGLSHHRTLQVANHQIICSGSGSSVLLRLSDRKLRLVSPDIVGRAVFSGGQIVVLDGRNLRVHSTDLNVIANFELAHAYNRIRNLSDSRVALSLLDFERDTQTDIYSVANGGIVWSPTTAGTLTMMPDGRGLFCADSGTSQIIDALGNGWQQPRRQIGQITAISPLSAGSSLVGSTDGSIRVLEHSTRSFQQLATHDGLVDCTGNERFVLSAGEGSFVVRDRSGRVLKTIDVQAAWNVSLTKEFGACLTSDGITVVDLASLSVKTLALKHALSIAFSPSGRWLAVGNEFGVEVYEAKTLVKHSECSPGGIEDAEYVVWLSDQQLVTAGNSEELDRVQLAFWNRTDTEWKEGTEVESLKEITALAAAGDSVLVGCGRRIVRVDSRGNTTLVHESHRATVYSIATLADGAIISGSIGEVIKTRRK